MAGPIRAFRFVHAAIHKELGDLETLALSLDPLDETRTAEFSDRLDEFKVLIKEHEGFEEAVVFPSLDERVPHVIRAYRMDHESSERYLAALGETLLQVRQGRDRAERTRPVRQLQRHAVALNATMSLHISKENEHVVPLADEMFSVEEQGGMLAKLGASIPPERMLPAQFWVVARLSAEEREDFFRTFQRMMPPPAFGGLVQYMARNLPAAEWDEVVRRAPDLAAQAG